MHIRGLESDYQNVLNEMVNFQRGLSQQDHLVDAPARGAGPATLEVQRPTVRGDRRDPREAAADGLMKHLPTCR